MNEQFRVAQKIGLMFHHDTPLPEDIKAWAISQLHTKSPALGIKTFNSKVSPWPKTFQPDLAELGVMHAELELGENYLNGWDGFKKDSKEGKYWLKKAHEHGSKDAEDACGCEFE